jgi:hypothetical protein
MRCERGRPILIAALRHLGPPETSFPASSKVAARPPTLLRIRRLVITAQNLSLEALFRDFINSAVGESINSAWSI